MYTQLSSSSPLMQILSHGDPLDTNVWYTVTLRNLTLGNQGFVLEINSEQVALIIGDFEGFDFDIFDGPLYIGGHPSFGMIQVCILMMQLVWYSTVLQYGI